MGCLLQLPTPHGELHTLKTNEYGRDKSRRYI
jgi:hypothetical protein